MAQVQWFRVSETTHAQSEAFSDISYTGWSNQRIIPELGDRQILEHFMRILVEAAEGKPVARILRADEEISLISDQAE